MIKKRLGKKYPKHEARGPSFVKNLKNFQEIFEKAKQSSHIDLKKVNRIRKAIREGQYQIDFEKIAEKLLED